MTNDLLAELVPQISFRLCVLLCTIGFCNFFVVCELMAKHKDVGAVRGYVRQVFPWNTYTRTTLRDVIVQQQIAFDQYYSEKCAIK